FFAGKKHTKIIFEGTEIVKDSTHREFAYQAIGTLTMKGVTKPATIHFNYIGTEVKESEKGKYKVAGFEGKTVVNRTDFGIGAGGGLGDNVTLNITLEAIQH
ncbi:MAG: hypothetical protein JWO32_290, partial [Bacteroidetes bacterium]|nr:hypothetical protein [Bacteroidota bacterium]